MSDFIVYSIPGSPYGRAVLATLEEKGARYSLHPVAPGTFRSEPHISRHPFGRVPVLDHGDYRLYETQAILRYLDRVRPTPPLTPADAALAGRMDQVLAINDWYFFKGVSDVIGFQRVVRPRVLGLTPDEAACAEAMPRAHQVFDEFGRLLGDQAYFAGDTVSLADLMLASHLDFLDGLPEWGPLTANHPNLIAWLARMNARPALQNTTWERVAEMAQKAA
jgi:glutathione S-transferase